MKYSIVAQKYGMLYLENMVTILYIGLETLSINQ